MREPTVTRSTAALYTARVGLEWADCYLFQDGLRASLTMQSTLGSYAHTWANIGHGKGFKKFLAGLSFDYFMQKTRGDYSVFDAEATAKKIAGDVLAAWRAKNLPRELALHCLDRLAEGWFHRLDDLTAFHMTLEASGIAETLYQNDLSGLAIMRPRGECVTFWREVWPVLCAAWTRERASG